MSSAISVTQVGAQVRGSVCVSLEKADSEAYKQYSISRVYKYNISYVHRSYWPSIAMITVMEVPWEFQHKNSCF